MENTFLPLHLILSRGAGIPFPVITQYLCGTGHLRTARAVITLPVSARTVPARGTLIP